MLPFCHTLHRSLVALSGRKFKLVALGCEDNLSQLGCVALLQRIIPSVFTSLCVSHVFNSLCFVLTTQYLSYLKSRLAAMRR
jgi:hypothetical protein